MKQIQTFNDGIVSIHSIKNIAGEGDLPKYELEKKHENIRFEERMVGMTRFWVAQQSDVQIDMVMRIPFVKDISPGHIAIPHDEKQYKIKQVQKPPDVYPPVLDLSLERLEKAYGTD